MKNLDRIAKWGLVTAIALVALAAWALYTVEHEAKHEHDWRLRSSQTFQEDFKPGRARQK